MKCRYPETTINYYYSTDMGECIFHTKLDEYVEEKEEFLEVKQPQVIECTKCGHKMRVIDES